VPGSPGSRSGAETAARSGDSRAKAAPCARTPISARISGCALPSRDPGGARATLGDPGEACAAPSPASAKGRPRRRRATGEGEDAGEESEEPRAELSPDSGESGSVTCRVSAPLRSEPE
jgi:hypothetical protein